MEASLSIVYEYREAKIKTDLLVGDLQQIDEFMSTFKDHREVREYFKEKIQKSEERYKWYLKGNTYGRRPNGNICLLYVAEDGSNKYLNILYGKRVPIDIEAARANLEGDIERGSSWFNTDEALVFLAKRYLKGLDVERAISDVRYALKHPKEVEYNYGDVIAARKFLIDSIYKLVDTDPYSYLRQMTLDLEKFNKDAREKLFNLMDADLRAFARERRARWGLDEVKPKRKKPSIPLEEQEITAEEQGAILRAPIKSKRKK